MIQRLRYKLLVNGTDYSRCLTHASPGVAMDAVNNMNLTLDNKRGEFSSSGPLLNEQSVVLSGSTDGGTTWANLFTGTLETIEYKIEPSGLKSVDCRCLGSKAMRGLMLTPNQVVRGKEDVGTVFVGSSADRNGLAWTADANGNYPNGILYKTSLSYAGITDLFGSINDLPNYIYMPGKYCRDAFDMVRNTTGLHYFVNDAAGTVTTFLNNVVTPFALDSTLTLSAGININDIGFKADTTTRYDRVTVLGSDPSICWSEGVGAHEYLYPDTKLTSLGACMAKARQMKALLALPRYTMDVETPAIVNDVVGERIKVVHPTLGLDGTVYGNVLGVRHDISADRWTTTFHMDNQDITDAKTLADIKKSIASISKDSAVGNAQVFCVGKPLAALTANPNICAIAFGTSSANGAGPLGVVEIVPTGPMVTESGTTNVYASALYTTGMAKGRIREVIPLANNGAGAVQHNTRAMYGVDWYQTPATRSNGWVAVGSITGAASLSSMSGYPIDVDYVSLNGYSASAPQYWFNAKLANNLRYNTQNLDFVPHPTSSAWMNSTVFNETNLVGLSIDNHNYVNSYGLTYTNTAMHSWMYTINTNIPYEYAGVVSIGLDYDISASAVRWNTNAVSMNDAASVRIDIWNNMAQLWLPLRWLPNEEKGVSTRYTAALGSWPQVIDPEGRVYVKVSSVVDTASGQYTASTEAHLAVSLLRGVITLDTSLMPHLQNGKAVHRVLEEAPFDRRKWGCALSRRPEKLLGVYSTFSFDGQGNAVGAGVMLTGYYTGKNGSLTYWTDGPSTYLDVGGAVYEYNNFHGFHGQVPFQVVNQQEKLYVEYEWSEEVGPTAKLPPPQTIDLSRVSMSYEPDGTHARLWLRDDDNVPPSTMAMEVGWTAVDGAPVARFTPVSASRIDQGICKDDRLALGATIYLTTSAGTSSTNQTFVGPGCD